MEQSLIEARLRRQLRRHDHRLEKAHPRSWERRYYGVGYQIVDDRNTVVEGCYSRQYESTLEECQVFADKLDRHA